MKIIAVTQRLIRYGAAQTVNNSSDASLYPFLISIGLLPVFLPCSSDVEPYFAHMDIQGILLSGGNDLSRFSHNDLDSMRDEFEHNLIETGIKRDIPIIGICRGMQVICEHFGAEIDKVDLHAGVRHSVKMVTPSRYFDMSVNTREVNSYHNYGVRSVSGELIAIASSPDSLTEAVEHKSLKICASMWHPEREAEYEMHDINVFKRLFGL